MTRGRSAARRRRRAGCWCCATARPTTTPAASGRDSSTATLSDARATSRPGPRPRRIAAYRPTRVVASDLSGRRQTGQRGGRRRAASRSSSTRAGARSTWASGRADRRAGARAVPRGADLLLRGEDFRRGGRRRVAGRRRPTGCGAALATCSTGWRRGSAWSSRRTASTGRAGGRAARAGPAGWPAARWRAWATATGPSSSEGRDRVAIRDLERLRLSRVPVCRAQTRRFGETGGSLGKLPQSPPGDIPLGRSGAVAQLVAHFHGMEGVRGSNPLSSTHAKKDPPPRVGPSSFLHDAGVLRVAVAWGSAGRPSTPGRSRAACGHRRTARRTHPAQDATRRRWSSRPGRSPRR